MWEEILKTALESGLWAKLFCVLLMYLLRDSRAREQKYRNTIDALVGKLDALGEVREGVRQTLEAVRGCGRRSRPKTVEISEKRMGAENV